MNLGLWWVIMIGIDQEDKMIEKINELGDELRALERNLNSAIATFKSRTGFIVNVLVDEDKRLHPFVTLTSQFASPEKNERDKWPREWAGPKEPRP